MADSLAFFGSTRKARLWIRLIAAFLVQVLFLAFVLPAFARNSTYAQEIWKDFGTASGAVLVLGSIWPALRRGGWKLRISALALCFFPLWVLGWVILQHFDFVPRWFS